jgi:hypothetical protein
MAVKANLAHQGSLPVLRRAPPPPQSSLIPIRSCLLQEPLGPAPFSWSLLMIVLLSQQSVKARKGWLRLSAISKMMNSVITIGIHFCVSTNPICGPVVVDLGLQSQLGSVFDIFIFNSKSSP